MGDEGFDPENYQTPGQLLQELLEARGWTQRILAIVLKIGETGINKILAGKQPVTAELALAFGEIFEVPAERFLDLQKKYDLAQARIVARPDPDRAKRAHLFGGLPIAEMIKRGWIEADDVRDVRKVESELVRFFGAGSIDEIEILPYAAKQTNVASETTPTQMAWFYRVRQIAREMIVGRYTQAGINAAIKRLDSLLSAPEEARKVPRILAEAGIRFILCEGLPRAKIDGVCFWLNNAPVIALTLRYDRIDNFWFVLRHECEHAVREHGKALITIDIELEGARAGSGDSVREEERVANEAAASFCVPKSQLDLLIAHKAPFFSERDILAFARMLRIHPGLVAGQLQHRTGRYDRFRGHQVKIRHHVRPGSMVDGWGNVAPVD